MNSISRSQVHSIFIKWKVIKGGQRDLMKNQGWSCQVCDNMQIVYKIYTIINKNWGIKHSIIYFSIYLSFNEN